MPTLRRAARETFWLSCHLDKGMFSDEVAVTYPANGPWRKSVFVPSSTVRGTIGDEGSVCVTVVRGDGTLFAVLPSACGDIVEIRESDVSA